MISVFWFGGSKTRLPSPEGGWQKKVARIKNHILQRLFGSAILLLRSDLGFLIWGVQDLFAFPRRGKANEKLLESKNLFSESCSQHPYQFREVISFFWFGGSKTCLPSPEGGRQTKSCSGGKTYLAKVDRSAHITIGKWSRFFDLGGPRLVCLPPKGEGKRKVARIKKLI